VSESYQSGWAVKYPHISAAQEGRKENNMEVHSEGTNESAPAGLRSSSDSPLSVRESLGTHSGVARAGMTVLKAGTILSGKNGKGPSAPEYPFWLLRDDRTDQKEEGNKDHDKGTGGEASGGGCDPQIWCCGGGSEPSDKSAVAANGARRSTDAPLAGDSMMSGVDASVRGSKYSMTNGVWSNSMTPEEQEKMRKLLEDMRLKVEKKTPAKRVRYIHDENQRRQTLQKTWAILINSMITQNSLPAAEALVDEDARKARVKELRDILAKDKANLIELLSQRPPGTDHADFRPSLPEDDPKAPLDFKYAYAYGPVGDLPMHTCFLLGLKDLGMDIIKTFYNSPSLISLPYTDDTKFWDSKALRGNEGSRVLDLRRCGQYADGGLFTGETVLHIAIVQQRDPELVGWMLRRGCNVVARATGAFFKPKEVRRRKVQGGGEDKRVSWGKRVQTMVVDVLQARPRRSHEQGGVTKRVLNDVSACDYGELPLSFAVSVGSLEICKLLLAYVVNAREELKKDKAFKEFRKWTKEALAAQSIEYEKKSMLQKMKEKWKEDWPELNFGDVLNEEAQRVHKEVSDLQGKKVTFYLMNSCVRNEDGKGNTALHMAVMHRHTHIIDWLMENGAKESLGFINDDNLTPFTLAARQGSVDIFYQFLTKYMQTTAWKYGEVQMSRMSLEQLDSFRMAMEPKEKFEQDGVTRIEPSLSELEDLPLHKKKWRSAIEVIVEHEVEAFANDPLFNKLIDDKWNKFGRTMYLRRTLVPYMVMLALFCIHMFLRCYAINAGWQRWNTDGVVFSDYGDEEPIPWTRLESGDLRREDIAAVVSFVIQVLLVVPASFPWLIHKGWRQRRLRGRDLDPNRTGRLDLVSFTFKNLSFFLDFLSAALLLSGFALRLARQHGAELDCLALTSVVMWSNLLNLIMPFKFFGIMAITTYKMLVGDVIRFLMVFVMTTMAFGLAMMVLFQKSDSPGDIDDMDVPGRSIIGMVWIAVGEVNMYDSIGAAPSLRHPCALVPPSPPCSLALLLGLGGALTAERPGAQRSRGTLGSPSWCTSSTASCRRSLCSTSSSR